MNDLKSRKDPSSVSAITNTLMEKCKKLTRINPDANLFICPILPTRDYEMNKRAIFMNHRIQVLAESCFKINVFDCNAFIDQVGLLQHRLCSKPGDPIHLSNVGISEMVKIIKAEIHPERQLHIARVSRENINSGSMTRGSMTRGSMTRGSMNHGSMNRGSVNSGRSNRGSVNRPGSVNMMRGQPTTSNTRYVRPQQTLS